MTATRLELINIADHGAKLKEPFTMIDLAHVDDLVLSIFLCQGTMPFHRHVDQDELFFVYSGTVSIDSEWGNLILRPGEMAMVPKSLGHRSASLLRSLVLLLQPRVAVERRNGHRFLFRPADEQHHLDKLSAPAMGRQLAIPFSPVLLTHLDTYAVHLSLCRGAGGWEKADHQATLVHCLEGRLHLETDAENVSLGPNELVVVPAGTAHHLSSTGRALVLGVTRHEAPHQSPVQG